MFSKKINLTPSLYLEAGAIHGCAVIENNNPIIYMEDVGRHNAVDKIAGYMFLKKIGGTNKTFYTTGRLTSEMVIKTVKMKIPILISRSGFTSWGVELAKKNNAKFILASTSEVYGDPLEHPQKESYFGNVNPIGPRSIYDEAKRFIESMTISYHVYHKLRVSIVRIFNTYGPRMKIDDGRVLPTFIKQAASNKNLTVNGDGTQTRSFCLSLIHI